MAGTVNRSHTVYLCSYVFVFVYQKFPHKLILASLNRDIKHSFNNKINNQLSSVQCMYNCITSCLHEKSAQIHGKCLHNSIARLYGYVHNTSTNCNTTTCATCWMHLSLAISVMATSVIFLERS